MREAARTGMWRGYSIMALLTALAFAPAITAPFIYDDLLTIPRNRSAQEFATALKPSPGTAVSGRPVVNATLVLNFQLNRAVGVVQPEREPVGYHLLNLAIHFAAGLLLIGIVRRTLRAQVYLPDAARHADSLALLIGAAWLVHPIQTEAVNYVIQRTELLMGLFYFGALYSSIRAWGAGGAASRRKWMAVAVVSCLLGMGSKETMATAPLMVLLYDRAFRVESWRALKSRIAFYAALWLTLIPLCIAIASNARNGTVGFGVGMPWYQYLYTQCWAILHYLTLVFWPAGLSIDYGIAPVRGAAGVPGLLLLSILFAATVVAWLRVPRWGWLAFLGAWFFVILAPSSSVVPILTEVAAERRMYLPLAAVLCAVVAGAWWLAKRVPALAARPTWWRQAAAVGIVALAAVSCARSIVYRSPEALWRDAMRKHPENSRAIGNLAGVHMQMSPPRLAAAESLYWQALRVDTLYTPALEHLATIAAMQGRTYDQHALLSRRIQLPPTRAAPYRRLGNLLVEHGNIPAGIGHLETAVRIQPTDTTLADLGRAYVAAERPREAAEAFERALQHNPNRLDVRQLLGHALVESGRPVDAIQVLAGARAMDASPRTMAFLAEAFAAAGLADSTAAAARSVGLAAANDLIAVRIAGRALLHVGRPGDALPYFAAALRETPNDVGLLTEAAQALIGQGRRREALDYLRRALAIAPQYEPALRLRRSLE